MRIQGCIKKASENNNNDRKGEASCLGTSKLLPVEWELGVVEDIGDLHVAMVGIGDLLLLGSNVGCSGRSGKTIKGENKAGVSI